MPVLADDAINIAGASVACTDDGDCFGTQAPSTSVCRDGFCYARKGRFVSVSPNPANAGTMTARRICVDAPGPGVHCRWVDAPVSYEPAGPGPVPVLVSDLGAPGPVFRDWSADPVDSQGNIVVHISGCAVSNAHTYIIQSILAGADPGIESNFSAPLSLPTAAIFGDPDGNTAVTAGDVFHAVKGFQNEQIIPKTWLKIVASQCAANPSVTLFADGMAVIKAKSGGSYLDQEGASAPGDCGPDGFGHCDPGASGACPADQVPTASIRLVPVKASGVEGVDWMAGPGPNDITLMHGGQNVVVDVFITNLGTDNVSLYQLGLDCNYAFSVAGSIDPFGVECPIAGLPFDSGECMGVDRIRADFVFEPASATIEACNTVDLCPPGGMGDPSQSICGALVLAGMVGSGPGDHYAATFGFAVSEDAEVVATVGVSLDPSRTTLENQTGCRFAIESVEPANIIIETDIGSCCGESAAPLFCADNLTASQCAASGGIFTVGGVCSGVEGPVPGLDGACPACQNSAQCIDSIPCTQDVCNGDGVCLHTVEPMLCCDPETGVRTLIDDENPCTDDACNPLTGAVTHVGSATEGVCAAALGSRYIAATPPCGLTGMCDDTSLVAMSLAVALGPAMIELGFIQPDGSVGETPVFETPSGWGSVEISGGFIRPSSTYVVTLEPMAGPMGGSSSSTTTAAFADVDGNGVVNFVDVQIAALVFGGDPLRVDLFADLDPCVPNHIVNVADILATVRGFQDQTFEDVCPIGVCCFDPGNPNSCGPSGPFGFGELREECPGDWSQGGACGPNGECP